LESLLGANDMKNFLTLLPLLFILTSCIEAGSDESGVFQVLNPVEPIPADEKVTFKIINDQITAPLCIRCHAWAGDESRVLSRIKAGEPESSRFYRVMEDGSMPKGGPEMTSDQLALVRRYIMDLVE
jgi:hypothetical protein